VSFEHFLEFIFASILCEVKKCNLFVQCFGPNLLMRDLFLMIFHGVELVINLVFGLLNLQLLPLSLTLELPDVVR